MNKTPRTLIIGARGQVGAAVSREVGPDYAITAGRCSGPDVQYALDLANLRALPRRLAELLAATRPDAVVNAAGMTWADGCEGDPDFASLINCSAAREVALQAGHFGAKSVYFSTEYVFDGTAGPYTETDAPEPLSVYGKTKLDGEREVLAVDPSALIIRTTVVYGPEEQGKNFAYQVESAIASATPLRAPVDQYSSPTYNVDLAEVTVALVQKGVSGICNVVGPEVMDRCTFARRLARAIGHEEHLIRAVTTESLCQRARRPRKAGLQVGRLRTLMPQFHLRTPEEAVTHWLSHQTGKAWPTKENINLNPTCTFSEREMPSAR